MTTYDYNLANLVTRLENKKGGTVSSSYAYTYYLDGNQASKTDHKGMISKYYYDKMGRLTQESKTNEDTIEYQYNRYSNRSIMITTGMFDPATVVYEYNLNNWLLKETKTGKEQTDHYDANGNEVYVERESLKPTKIGDLNKIHFTKAQQEDRLATVELKEYNGFNQLIEGNYDGTTVIYHYRPDGMRHSKVIRSLDGSASNHYHIWDSANIIAEYGANGSIFARYLRGVGLIWRDIGGQVEYYLFNAHGDVVQRTSANGTTLKNYDYDAFGVERDLEVLDNPFRYCGEYYEKESKTYYLRARYYNPRTGRFEAEDPAKDGLNWYTYCGGNPVNYWDPTGMYISDEIDRTPQYNLDILKDSYKQNVKGRSYDHESGYIDFGNYENNNALLFQRFNSDGTPGLYMDRVQILE